MPWQSKVPFWVLNAVAGYIIPDDTNFVTSSSFQSLDEPVDSQTFSESTYTGTFPGLVPNFELEVESTPTTGGLDIALKLSKAIGFYGVLSTILSYDPKKLNNWTFPLVRRNFGYLALSRGSKVSEHGSVHYERQYHIDNGVLLLASNYDVERTQVQILNSIEQFSLTRVDGFQYPSVVTRIGFLPILEEWAVRFFQTNG